MSETTYYQRNREEKDVKKMSEENKKRLKKYQKHYCEAKKHISQMQICQ